MVPAIYFLLLVFPIPGISYLRPPNTYYISYLDISEGRRLCFNVEKWTKINILYKNKPDDVDLRIVRTGPHKKSNNYIIADTVLYIDDAVNLEILVSSTKTRKCSNNDIFRRDDPIIVSFWNVNTANKYLCSYLNENVRIEVDLQNVCHDTLVNQQPYPGNVGWTSTWRTPLATNKPNPLPFSCKKNASHVICTSQTERDATHQWFQYYDNKNIHIGMVSPTNGTISVFVIRLEKFDNNSEIFSYITTNGLNKSSHNPIKFSPNEFDEDNNITTLRYSEKNSFTCWPYYNIIGIINMTQNRISTYIQNQIQLNMMFNGSIICCIHYTKININGGLKFTRYVVNKTLLIYQNELPGSNPVDGFKHNLIYLAATVIGILILILICICITIRKLRQKNSNKGETLELETDTAASQVIYAELQIPDGPDNPPGHQEETHYARIIGELKPGRRKAKK